MTVQFTNTALPDVIELKNVNQEYYDQKKKKTNVVIKDLNLLIEDKPNQGQFVVILGKSGCGKCVVGNTWILTDGGIRLISDLVKHRKEGLQIENNLFVIVNGKPEKISHTYYGDIKDTLILKFSTGDELEGSFNHPVLVWEDFKFIWKELKSIKTGDYLIKEKNIGIKFNSVNRIHMPIHVDERLKKHELIRKLFIAGFNKNQISKKINMSPITVARAINCANKYEHQIKQPCYLSKNIAYYLGILAGDGCIKSKSVGFTSMDLSLINFYKKFNKNILGIKTTTSVKKDSLAVLLRPLRRNDYEGWVHKIFGGDCYNSDTKPVPEIIRKAGFHIQLKFLQGLFDTDGSIDQKNSRAEISLNSKKLIDFICNMLFCLGISYNLTKRKKSYRISTRKSKKVSILFNLTRKKLNKKSIIKNIKHQSHIDVIPGSYKIIFSALKNINELPVIIKNSIGSHNCGRDFQRSEYNRIQIFLKNKNINIPDSPNFDFIKVENIAESRKEVFDLTNPISQSFIANGFIVHNSTVLRYIAGLQEPTSGQVLIHGKPRTKDTKISMVFQKYSSFPWLSVLDNVALGLEYARMPKKERREKAMQMIEIVGLTGHEHKYPAELSGGQQQRVAIARSLICNSSILLMDEPFGALDIYTRLRMQDFLADIWRKALQDMTIIFVTHDIPEAVYLGDDIWIMSANPGQIAECVHVDIPIYRAKDMKRDKKFTDYVYYIEDRLNESNPTASPITTSAKQIPIISLFNK